MQGMLAFKAKFSLLTGRRELSEIKWLARVESVRVKTITPDLFGQVASGSLVITGPLGVLKVTENKSPKPNMPGDVLEACDHSADIFWDSKDLHKRFGGERTSAIWSYKTYHAAPARNASSYGDDVFVMPLRIMDYDYFNYDYEAPMLQGLLLLPCADAQGTYRRVGQLTISAHAHREAFEGGKWPLQSKTKIVSPRLYQSAWENGEYNISVV